MKKYGRRWKIDKLNELENREYETYGVAECLKCGKIFNDDSYELKLAAYQSHSCYHSIEDMKYFRYYEIDV